MSKMAYSEEPDKVEVYKKKGTKYNLVLNFFNQFPGMVNWHHEYPDKSVGEADACEQSEIMSMIQFQKWKLVSSTEKPKVPRRTIQEHIVEIKSIDEERESKRDKVVELRHDFTEKLIKTLTKSGAILVLCNHSQIKQEASMYNEGQITRCATCNNHLYKIQNTWVTESEQKVIEKTQHLRKDVYDNYVKDATAQEAIEIQGLITAAYKLEQKRRAAVEDLQKTVVLGLMENKLINGCKHLSPTNYSYCSTCKNHVSTIGGILLPSNEQSVVNSAITALDQQSGVRL